MSTLRREQAKITIFERLTVLSAIDSDLERHQDYLDHGECWGHECLVDEQRSATPAIQPYFGLCNPMVMSSLEEPVEVDAGIAFLRYLATNIGLKAQDAIICYSDRKAYHTYYEYCTAVPHQNSQGQEIHARSIKARTRQKPYQQKPVEPATINVTTGARMQYQPLISTSNFVRR
jgi:hypothetical protein